MTDKILIFGRGYMAGNIERFYKGAATISSVDITDFLAVKQVLREYAPTVVINAAGKTNIDWCEDHRLEALNVNVTGPLLLLRACTEANVFLCQLASGCIFDGAGTDGKGFREEDVPSPGCFYGWTKAWLDMMTKEFPVLSLRLRAPVASEPNPRNLLNKLMAYSKVIDDQNSITVVEDFLPVMQTLIKRRATGIYHVTNPGTTSPYQIALLLKQYVQPDKAVTKIAKSELDSMTKARRVNTVINTDKLEKEGFSLPPIRGAVENAVKAFAQALKAQPHS